ncbi:ACR3 family arsenite efflux transporter [Leptospira selangorensis]|uniref:ACR3 family arsenite efflux transporter n=1 Tax=Leptospira selangorensis TaxID=2484982 RepID=A0A5F2C533_9LEPT|nr:ACR3 family arsenite efflux transporter [Leptospira selangorensis]TGM10811.1 ACR3 family arsenite efflux transporter [Leptospira selangorensis]TGM26846.1 ACR3 family arsenite efflux transporter [Leptospira selangorensis]
MSSHIISEKRLSFLDKFLTVWIFIAMGIGVSFSIWSPGFVDWIRSSEFGGTNLPIAIGLIFMMVPPLAKVNFTRIPKAFGRIDLVLYSLLLNWVVGPLLMFGLAFLFFPENQEYRIGLILIGIARCIAMVLVWNDLADGDREVAAGLVALNSIFQLLFYGVLAYLFVSILPGTLGFTNSSIHVSYWDIAYSVLIYLGIPFLLGWGIRTLSFRFKGEEWTTQKLLPTISPITLIFLLLTIVFIFSLKGDSLINIPLDVLKISAPLLIYFILMFFFSFGLGLLIKADYPRNVAVSFTAAGNNFELAIAVAIGTFGIASGQAFVGIVGPLVEIPVLVLLVEIAKIFKQKFYLKRGAV